MRHFCVLAVVVAGSDFGFARGRWRSDPAIHSPEAKEYGTIAGSRSGRRLLRAFHARKEDDGRRWCPYGQVWCTGANIATGFYEFGRPGVGSFAGSKGHLQYLDRPGRKKNGR